MDIQIKHEAPGNPSENPRDFRNTAWKEENQYSLKGEGGMFKVEP